MQHPWSFTGRLEKLAEHTIVHCERDARQLLRVYWSTDTAMCGDAVELRGDAVGYPPGTEPVGAALHDGVRFADLAANSSYTSGPFVLPWVVRDVVFSGAGLPATKAVTGEILAPPHQVSSESPLEVARVPNHSREAIRWNITAGRFGWTAAFRFSLTDDTIRIEQTLHVRKAWLAKWISFDRALDGRDDWVWVKKVGTRWKFWDTTATPASWQNLPRPIDRYTVNPAIFIKQGTQFVGADDPSLLWPAEPFVDPPNYETMKAAWLNNALSVWGNHFRLKRRGCESNDAACCAWPIRIEIQWNETAGDKEVYAVWSQEYERSDARDWYLSDPEAETAGHEVGHLLGAYDEYPDDPPAALDPATNLIDDDSIMGMNLTVAHPRHLHGLRDQVARRLNATTGRSWEFDVL